LETGSRGDVNQFLELDHLALPLLFASQLEVLGSLDGDLNMVKLIENKSSRKASRN
jgi:hypothetical protein